MADQCGRGVREEKLEREDQRREMVSWKRSVKMPSERKAYQARYRREEEGKAPLNVAREANGSGEQRNIGIATFPPLQQLL